MLLDKKKISEMLDDVKSKNSDHKMSKTGFTHKRAKSTFSIYTEPVPDNIYRPQFIH